MIPPGTPLPTHEHHDPAQLSGSPRAWSWDIPYGAGGSPKTTPELVTGRLGGRHP